MVNTITVLWSFTLCVYGIMVVLVYKLTVDGTIKTRSGKAISYKLIQKEILFAESQTSKNKLIILKRVYLLFITLLCLSLLFFVISILITRGIIDIPSWLK